MVVRALRVREVWVRFPVFRPISAIYIPSARIIFRLMKIIILHPSENAVSLLRRAGYVFQHTQGLEQSFVRKLGQSGYPRFHAYVKTEHGDILINFHLDQKRETYGDETRHHGEYENEGPLQTEAAHLLHLFGPNAKII